MSLNQPAIGRQVRDQIKSWLLFRLGHPIVKVEVTNAMLDMAIDEAVRRFSQWVPGSESFFTFRATAGQGSYDLLELIPDYQEIREVIYNASNTDPIITSFLGGITTDFSYGSNQTVYYMSNISSMTDFTIWNLYQEMYQRVIGREGQWKILDNHLYLNPTPVSNVWVGVIYNRLLDDNDLRRDEWVKEWALSEIKMALGTIRRKYGSLPGPRGDITMDGAELVSEAKEAQTELRERINEFRAPVMPIIG